MNLELKDKVVLVTGSSRGIGKSIALSFLSEGARVVITGRNETSLQQTFKELSKLYSEDSVLSYQGDLTDNKEISKCISSTIEKFGKIDILIANIGTGKSRHELVNDQSEWERIFKLNLTGGLGITMEVIPIMRKIGGGNIIFISSIAGYETIGAPLIYSVAKSGLISASKNLSRILANDNIRVNTVAPGNIIFKGGRWEEKIKENPNIIDDYIKKKVPMKRLGKPEEISAAVLFLASERASFITGVCLVVDGGETVSIM